MDFANRDVQQYLLQNQQAPHIGGQQSNNNNGYNPNFGQEMADLIQGKIRRKTHLIQLYTSDPDEGPRLISQTHPIGVPIMIIVTPPSSCYFKLNIPHGIVSLEQVWGRHTGQMTPGYHCCYCSHKKIAAMITKNSIQFNTPIELCPTKDNVRVSVDIGITFHIGREETRADDCQKFLYYLGANKLEELLEQESEESIRNFVRTIKVNQIRDIKSELTSQMMAELNQRFNNYGVFIEKVNVMNVIIPRDLRHALQQATTFDVLLQNQVKANENSKIKLMNENNMTQQTLVRNNQKKMVELEHQEKMAQIKYDKQIVMTQTEQQMAVVEATQKQSIKIIQGETVKAQAEMRAKKTAEDIIAEAKAYSERVKISTEATKEALTSQAKTKVEVSKNRANAQTVEADAEQTQASNLDNKRKHDERMKQTSNLTQVSRKNKIVVSGKSGEEILGFFKDTNDMVGRIE